MNKVALSDCQELLEYAVEELQDAIESSDEGDAENIRRRSKDLKNWLSAVMSYQVVCIDGLTQPELKANMTNNLGKATELTKNALAIITEITRLLESMKGALNLKNDVMGAVAGGGAAGRKLLNSDVGGRYPEWFSASDRKLLRATNVAPMRVKPNAVVAKDGSGQYKTIQHAIDAIPKDNKGRYIIYVKAGVYRENVIISKKILNVFMYGDGSRKTIVTGNKNFVDGTPTFRTATFGTYDRYQSISIIYTIF